MMSRRRIMLAAGLALLLVPAPAAAQSKKMQVVATFSILADLSRNVGGDRIEVTSLVAPDGDAHTFSPSPADAKTLARAKVIVVNGLDFEGWMTRLIKASGTKATRIVATNGVRTRKMEEEHRDGVHGKEEDHDDEKHAHDEKNGHGKEHAHEHGETDPHAWQSVANAKIYVANIRDGLSKVDPAGASIYAANAKAYLAKLDALEAEVKGAIAKIPADRRKIITNHDAFGYFSAAYDVEFISPEGVSTDTDASAKDVARIITQIKEEKIPAVFLENISDPRLMQQIAKESGAKIGGKLFSDALSGPAGPAATYIDMMRHNIKQFSIALTH